jgi:sugar O-acyltransferase (sialic acid O-acetyltransferase NeuD family)
MRKLVIFGLDVMAELAHFYFSRSDSPYQVSAFTADKQYINNSDHLDLPVVDFDSVAEQYPPTEYDMFIAIGYAQMNKLRTDKYYAAKAKGYKLASYISNKATTFSNFACGENCFIFEDNTIQPFVTIGNNVTLWSGNHIGHHSIIEDNVFITSHVVVGGKVSVGTNTFIGGNALLRDSIKIGHDNLIGGGAIVWKDTNPYDVYITQPTKKLNLTSDKIQDML